MALPKTVPAMILLLFVVNLLVLTGCHSTSVTSFSLPKKIAETTPDHSNSGKYSSQGSEKNPALVSSSKSNSSSVKDSTSDPLHTYSIYFGSINFLDSDTGWLIKQYGGSGSKEIYALFKTEDEGKHWSLVGQSNLPLDNLDFVSENKGWAISESKSVSLVSTQDGGKTWRTTWSDDSADARASRSPDQLHFFDASNGYAKIGNELLFTSNGGEAWTKLDLGERISRSDITLDAVDFHSTDTGWISLHRCPKGQPLCQYSVYQTLNTGKTWRRIFQKNTEYHETASSLSFPESKDGWLLLGGYECAMRGCVKSDLYHTSDGGEHWSKVSKNLGAFPWKVIFTSKTTGYLLAEGGAAGSPLSMMYTKDGGQTWSHAEGLPDNKKDSMTNFGGVDFHSSETHWFSSTLYEGEVMYAAVYKYDGKRWQSVYQEKATHTMS